MTERSEAKADPLETIDVANTPDDDATSDQPIPDDVQYFGDQTETEII